MVLLEEDWEFNCEFSVLNNHPRSLNTGFDIDVNQLEDEWHHENRGIDANLERTTELWK